MQKLSFNLERFVGNETEKNLFGEPVFEKKDRRKGITNERQVIIQSIVKLLEMDKQKVILGRLLKRLKGIPNYRLYEIISESKDYKNRGKKDDTFSKGFYGQLKKYEKIINDKGNTAKNASTNE